MKKKSVPLMLQFSHTFWHAITTKFIVWTITIDIKYLMGTNDISFGDLSHKKKEEVENKQPYMVLKTYFYSKLRKISMRQRS